MFIQDFFGIRSNVTLHVLYRKIDVLLVIQGTKLLIYFKTNVNVEIKKLQNVNSFHSFLIHRDMNFFYSLSNLYIYIYICSCVFLTL